MAYRNGGKRAWLLLPVFAGVLWATCGPFVRSLTAAGMNPVTVLFARGAFGVLLLGAFLALSGRRRLALKARDAWLFAGAGVLGMTALNLCYVRTINTLDLSFAAVLLGMAPIFSAAFGSLCFGERMTERKLLGIFLAIMGCVLVSGVADSGGGGVTAPGVAIGLGSAFFFAVNSLFSRLALDRGYASVAVTFYSLVAMSVVLCPFAQWDVLGAYLAAAPARRTLFLLLHSLCTAVLPYILFTLALDHAEVGAVSAIASSSEPVAAAVYGMLLYGEDPTVATCIGMAAVVAAIVLFNVAAPAGDRAGKAPGGG